MLEIVTTTSAVVREALQMATVETNEKKLTEENLDELVGIVVEIQKTNEDMAMVQIEIKSISGTAGKIEFNNCLGNNGRFGNDNGNTGRRKWGRSEGGERGGQNREKDGNINKHDGNENGSRNGNNCRNDNNSFNRGGCNDNNDNNVNGKGINHKYCTKQPGEYQLCELKVVAK